MKTADRQRRILGLSAVAAGLLTALALVMTTAGGGATARRGPGPEGAALVTAPALSPAASPSPGQTVDGIGCGSSEQLRYHVHARLTIFVRGRERSVPAGVGIGEPLQTTPPDGTFVTGGTCFALLHTHASDGIVHIESPQAITYVLEQFFAVWGQSLGTDHVGPANGRVTAFVDGRRYPGDPRAIPLAPHAQIQLDVGAPVVPPRHVPFPASL